MVFFQVLCDLFKVLVSSFKEERFVFIEGTRAGVGAGDCGFLIDDLLID